MNSTIFANIAIFLMVSCHCLNFAQAFNCGEIVKQEGDNDGQLNYLANVSFTVPKAIEGDWTLEMNTDVPFTFLGGWGVWIKSDPDEGKAEFRSRLENNTLAEGDQVSFRFRISWVSGDDQPNVISLTWEGVQLCKEDVNDNKMILASRRRRTSDKIVGANRRVNYRKRYFINL